MMRRLREESILAPCSMVEYDTGSMCRTSGGWALGVVAGPSCAWGGLGRFRAEKTHIGVGAAPPLAPNWNRAQSDSSKSPESDSNRRPPPYHGGALAC